MTNIAPVKLENKIKIVLGINFSILGEGIKKILEEDQELIVVEKANNLLDLVEIFKNGIGDVFLIDYELPGFDTSSISSLLRNNDSKKLIVMLDKDYPEDTLVEIVSAGVHGYLLKNSNSEHLRKSVKSVYKNELWVERKILTRVVKDAISGNKTNIKDIENRLVDLTETESKIVKLALRGYSNKKIASHLYLSDKTVKFHLYKVFKKLSIKNRSELILYCFKSGLVS